MTIRIAFLLALVATLPAPIAQADPGDFTGAAVSAAGDLDGDGYADYLVGSPGAQRGQGRVEVYYGRPDEVWIPGTTLRSNQDGSAFGRAVAGLGDVNGDGFDDVAIGQPLYAGSGVANGGRVWIYMGGASGLTVGAGVTIVGLLPEAQFGAAVAGAGDVNGDGYADLLVGAPYAQRTGGAPASHGEASLYYGSPGGILRDDPVVLAGTTVRQFLGFAVAGAGDIDGDGYADVAIGAPGDETDSVPGRVHLYRGSAGGLIFTPAEILTGGSRGGRFGAALSPVADRDGDRRGELAIGAPGDSVGALAGAGRVYLRRSAQAGRAIALLDGTQAGAHLGAALADAGDVHLDGRNEILVGEPDFDEPRWVDAGRVHLIPGATGEVRVYGGLGSAGTHFGSAVAGVGNADGDGYDDFLLGSPGSISGGWVILIRGITVVGAPDPDLTPIPPALTFERAFPNPAVGAGQLTQIFFVRSAQLDPAPATGTFTIHDSRGRLVREIPQAHSVHNRVLLHWDGRDAEGAPVKPGVYFVRATVWGESAGGTIVRL